MSPIFDIALFFAVQSMVDFTNPTIVTLVRTLYVLVCGMYYLAATQVQSTLKAKNPPDSTPLWIPPPKTGFGGVGAMMDSFFGPSSSSSGAAAVGPDASTYQRKTMTEYELEIIDKLVQGAGGPRIMPFMFSMAMNVHIMLALAVVKVPMEILQHILFKKYLLGLDIGATPNYGGGEIYTDPGTGSSGSNPEIEASASTSSSSSLVAQGGGGEGNGSAISSSSSSSSSTSSSHDNEMEDAIFRTWEAAQDPAPLSWFEELKGKGKNMNTQTRADKWSLLMVVSGGTQNGPAEVKKVMELGCNPLLQDKEGWTALHWAAYHGCADAVLVLTESLGSEKIKKIKKTSSSSSSKSTTAAADDDEDPAATTPTPETLTTMTTTTNTDDSVKALLRLKSAKGETAYALAQAQKYDSATKEQIIELLTSAMKKAGVALS